MSEADRPQKELPDLKKPLIALAISAGAIAVGSAICLPGICGCASWLGLTNTDSYGKPFLILALIGVLGLLISIVWLIVSALRRRFS